MCIPQVGLGLLNSMPDHAIWFYAQAGLLGLRPIGFDAVLC